MKFFLFLSLFLPFQTEGQRNQEELKAIIKSRADEMGVLFLKGDYESFVQFMYPEIVSKFGGEQNIIDRMNEGKEDLRSKGFVLKTISFGEPSDIVVSDSTLQCIIPQTITIQMQGGMLRSTASLLAISENGGGIWYFTDVSKKSSEELQNLIPVFNKELNVPVWKEPIFIPN